MSIKHTFILFTYFLSIGCFLCIKNKAAKVKFGEKLWNQSIIQKELKQLM